MSRTVDDAGSGLVLQPFRGVRYAQDAVDLAAVTSPPYDLIGPGEAQRLEAQEPHNLVRLTLPDPSAPDDRYGRAGRLLGQWLDTGVLRRDDRPALYVYEERGADHVQRGLLGAVGLRAPEDAVILPHEDVHPVPVADRIAQMRATGANLEPIYLLVPGTGAAADVVAATAERAPLLTARATWNGQPVDYRLWSITDPDDLATVATALHKRQALIADGHHRYAAYRALQADRHAAGAGPGPWDYGLAFLVDSAAYPPTLQPIHRVVPNLKPADFLAALPRTTTVTDAGPSLEAALTAAAHAAVSAAGSSPAADSATGSARATDAAADTVSVAAGGCPGLGVAGGSGAAGGGRHVFVVAGGDGFHLVRLPGLVAGSGTADGGGRGQGEHDAQHSAAWYGLDVSLLHQVVLGELLQVPDDQVRFVHTAAEAVRLAAETDGTALLLNPPTEADVHAVAAAGDRMPRKSTSFGPKPRNGLVLRLLTP